MPLLFIVYASEIYRIAHERGFPCHCYVHDTQLYFHIKPNEATVTNSVLESCISDIRRWLASNRLQLNPDKTELMWRSSARSAGSFMKFLLMVQSFEPLTVSVTSKLSYELICP